MTPEDLRRSLELVLRHLWAMLPQQKDVWDADEKLRLAVERLWITAGNVADKYRRATLRPHGSQPWTDLYKYRNVLAHALPGDVSADRVWLDSHASLRPLIQAVRRHQPRR